MTKTKTIQFVQKTLRGKMRELYLGYDDSDNVFMPEDAAKIAIDEIDWSEYTVGDMMRELAIKEAISVQRQFCKHVPPESIGNGQLDLFPTEYDEAGFTIDGGFIKHKNANAHQATIEFKHKTDNSLAVAKAQSVAAERYAEIMDGFLKNPSFKSVGQVLEWIRDSK